MEQPKKNLVAAESAAVAALAAASVPSTSEDARALADWELALVGGGDTTPCW